MSGCLMNIPVGLIQQPAGKEFSHSNRLKLIKKKAGEKTPAFFMP